MRRNAWRKTNFNDTTQRSTRFTGVTRGTGQRFAFDHRNVLVSFRVVIFFTEAKIDQVKEIRGFADAHEEIFRF